MIEQEIIEEKIDIIMENLGYLRHIGSIDKEEFLKSYEKPKRRNILYRKL